MKNTKRFTRHAKNITLSGNVKFNHKSAHDPYSRYVFQKKRKDITRIEFLDSYFMVTEWFNDELNTPLVLMIDDKDLVVVPSEDSEECHFVDVSTGEVMLTLDMGCVIYSTPWAEEIYRWGK